MKKNGNKRSKENSWSELVEMQTEFALLSSMLKSKTLTIMVVVFVLSFSGFCYFLYRMAT